MAKLFQDDSKNLSLMRFMCFILIIICCLLIIFLAVMVTFKEGFSESIREFTILILGVLGVAIGGKALQKFAEK